jgi:hypothetical protein
MKNGKEIFGKHVYFSVEYTHPFLFGYESIGTFITKLVNIQ